MKVSGKISHPARKAGHEQSKYSRLKKYCKREPCPAWPGTQGQGIRERAMEMPMCGPMAESIVAHTTLQILQLLLRNLPSQDRSMRAALRVGHVNS
jgi:hypothetical protein